MLTDKEIIIASESKVYITSSKEYLIEKFIGTELPTASKDPVSIFMAGSAGAGKTEFSKSFLKSKLTNFENVVRIDADEIRDIIPAYRDGKCSAWVVTPACTKGVHILHDYSIKNSLDFILDGTFSESHMAITNVDRSLKHKRFVEIYYLYQEPQVAWRFTQERELLEKRDVTKEFFVESLLRSREVVELVKTQFKNKVRLNAVKQDRNNEKAKIWYNINSLDATDIPTYNESDLINMLL